MKKAVLIIHGLGGNPDEHKSIISYLSKDFAVYTYVLPGHDNKLFSRPKKEDWIKTSENEIEKLYEEGYSDIYVIGHSMGGVIASYLSTKYKRIKKIVLEAPAYACNSIPRIVSKIFKYYSLKFLFSAAIHFTPQVLKEFKKLIEECKDYPKKINIPTLILQGKDDVIVPYETADKIYKQIPSKEKYYILVNDAPHTFCTDKIYDDIMPIIKDFFENKHFNIKKHEYVLTTK